MQATLKYVVYTQMANDLFLSTCMTTAQLYEL